MELCQHYFDPTFLLFGNTQLKQPERDEVQRISRRQSARKYSKNGWRQFAGELPFARDDDTEMRVFEKIGHQDTAGEFFTQKVIAEWAFKGLNRTFTKSQPTSQGI